MKHHVMYNQQFSSETSVNMYYEPSKKENYYAHKIKTRFITSKHVSDSDDEMYC